MRIVSDNDAVSEIISHYVEQVEQCGGFIHPDLVFYCDKTHPWGSLRLEGVGSSDKSLAIPVEYAIQDSKRQGWSEIYSVLGYEMDSVTRHHRSFNGVIVPLLDMANSGKNGRFEGSAEHYTLYGCEFEYKWLYTK